MILRLSVIKYDTNFHTPRFKFMMGNLLPRQMCESKIKLIFVEVWTGIMFHNKGPAEYNL